MTRLPDPGELLASQKHLRGQLLDRHGAISWWPARELAAQLMLRLDEPHSCWQFAAEWIQVAMDVERVDGGYGSPSAPTYALGSAEARRPDMDVPSLQGLHISNDDPVVACLLASPQPIVIPKMAPDGHQSPDEHCRVKERHDAFT